MALRNRFPKEKEDIGFPVMMDGQYGSGPGTIHSDGSITYPDGVRRDKNGKVIEKKPKDGGTSDSPKKGQKGYIPSIFRKDGAVKRPKTIEPRVWKTSSKNQIVQDIVAQANRLNGMLKSKPDTSRRKRYSDIRAAFGMSAG